MARGAVFKIISLTAQLLFDDDDRVYHTVTRYRFTGPVSNPVKNLESWITEIDLATGTTLSPPVLARQSPLNVAEGCHIIKHEGMYYLFVAEGGTEGGHRECVYRAAQPMGPYLPPPDGVNPLIFNHGHPRVQNTGHLDLVAGDDGKWVGVCLGVRPVFPVRRTTTGMGGMPSQLGRETFLVPVEWVDGWPVVNGRKDIDLEGTADFGVQLPVETHWEDAFDTETLSLGWYHVRVPLRTTYAVSPRGLALRGGPDTLDVDHCPSLLLRKQTAFNLDWSTEVDFSPKFGEEAGTVAWIARGAYASLGVRGTEHGREVVFKRPVGDADEFVVSCTLDLTLSRPKSDPGSRPRAPSRLQAQ